MTLAELRAALARIARIPFAPLPTPIEPMPRLSAIIGGYDGPGSENRYLQMTEIHDDPKLRRFVPHAILDAKTSGLMWHRKDEYNYPVDAGSALKISQAGGKVCVGGHGELQGLSFHWQLWSLQSGGMSNLEALRAAKVLQNNVTTAITSG